MINHVIIMAGGAGSRLWPASHSKRPKQFMKIGGDDSLIVKTIKRGFSLGHEGYIIIVTHKDHVKLALDECSVFPEEKRKRIVILPEPFARNTAPALTLAAMWLKSIDEEDSSVIVLAADHIIEPIEAFISDVEKASILAKANWIVPFGIPPLDPETGYGYIEAGENLSVGKKVISFKEKPDLKTAELFLKAGNFYWNSGMFVYNIKTYLSELKRLTPEVAKIFEQLTFSTDTFDAKNEIIWMKDLKNLEPVYDEVLSISIDYALMEKSDRIAMVETSFSWNDVGSWDVISDIDKHQSESIFSVESENNYVYSDIPVTLCGVEDLMVVIENGKALVCKKGNSQLVKNAVDMFKANDRIDLL